MRSFVCLGIITLFAFVGSGCGDLQRENPADPQVSGGLHLHEQLIGYWSLDEGDVNQVYFFKNNGGVELHSYTSLEGSVVDRNAPFPQTSVSIFAGTYLLAGRTLTLSFTSVTSNDPDTIPLLPRDAEVVRISIARNTLTMEGEGAKRSYLRQ